MTEHNEKKQAFEKNDDFEKQSEYVNADSDKCRDELTGKSTEILKECFDAQITKQLEENPPGIPTYEQFSAMIDKDQIARRHRKRRITGIAACFVAAVLIGVFAFGLPGSDVDADNNPKEEITTEDGVIIEDGGWGSSEEEDNVWVTDDWEHVADAKQMAPQLLIPTYIPQDYQFKQLIVENIEEEFQICEYLFVNKDGATIELEVVFKNTSLGTLEIENVARTLKCKEGDIYVQEYENKIATIQKNDGIIIYVIGKIPDGEIIKIINGLNYKL